MPPPRDEIMRRSSNVLWATIATIILFVLSPMGLVRAETVGRNIDITRMNDPNDLPQMETMIAVDPTNPSILVTGAIDARLFIEGGNSWLGYYRSTNGGKTWDVSLLPGFPGDTSPEGLASPLSIFFQAVDPVLAFDKSGNVFYTGIATRLFETGLAGHFGAKIFVATYVDHGATYQSTILFDIPGNHDKPWIAVDTSENPETGGNVYVVWTGSREGPDFSQVGHKTLFSRSTDHGATFSTATEISGMPGLFSAVTVDPMGNVFVSAVNSHGSQQLLVARSTDGGLSFDRPVKAASLFPSSSLGSVVLPENIFKKPLIPQLAADENGEYVVWDDFKTRDTDVLFIGSTDGGKTWSDPVVVNDVRTGHQFFPTIAVSGGRISVAWYDSRLDDGGRIEELHVFYAQSTDGGVSFSANLRITDVGFDPNVFVLFTDLGLAFIGDYIHIAATPEKAHVIWADTRNACNVIFEPFGCVDVDVFTAAIRF